MQTNPFWISILAWAINKEKIRWIEIVGIFVCFGCVLMVGYSKSQNKVDDDSEDAEAVDAEEKDE